MAELTYPAYRLSGATLQAWLRRTFNDDSIKVEPRNAYWVFTLSDGVELTSSHRAEIKQLLV